jgi:hypothetical protein
MACKARSSVAATRLGQPEHIPLPLNHFVGLSTLIPFQTFRP